MINKFLNHKAASREFQILLKAVGDYYRRDGDARVVDPDVLAAQLEAALPNPKHQKLYTDLVMQAAATDVSSDNIAAMVIGAKRREISTALAVALTNNDNKQHELLEQFRELQGVTSLDQLDQQDDVVVVDSSTIHSLIEEYVSNEGAFQLYPRALNSALGGRLNKGHHLTTFASPEMGKTALNCTFAAGFCMQKRRGIYFLNEDKNTDVYFRIVSSLTGLTFEQIRADPKKAIELAKERGIDNLILIGMAPGNLRIIQDNVEKLDVEWFLVDQLINLNEKGDGKNVILGKGAYGVRNIGKMTNTLALSTCQGADSADGKVVLEQGDVYMSNVEVPAACDVLAGIGANKDMLDRGERAVTLCKNKLTGDHSTLTLRLQPAISRYTSD